MLAVQSDAVGAKQATGDDFQSPQPRAGQWARYAKDGAMLPYKYLNRRSLARSFKIARSFEMLPPAWQPTSSYQLPAELHRLVERAQTMRNIERTQFHGISFIATIRCFLYRICRCLELTPACALSYEKAQASECCFYCFWKPSNEQIGSSDWCWRSRQNCYTAASSDSLYHCTMI